MNQYRDSTSPRYKALQCEGTTWKAGTVRSLGTRDAETMAVQAAGPAAPVSTCAVLQHSTRAAKSVTAAPTAWDGSRSQWAFPASLPLPGRMTPCPVSSLLHFKGIFITPKGSWVSCPCAGHPVQCHSVKCPQSLLWARGWGTEGHRCPAGQHGPWLESWGTKCSQALRHHRTKATQGQRDRTCGDSSHDICTVALVTPLPMRKLGFREGNGHPRSHSFLSTWAHGLQLPRLRSSLCTVLM